MLHQKAPFPTDPVVDTSDPESDHQVQKHAEDGGGDPTGERGRSQKTAGDTLKNPDGRHSAERITDNEGGEDVEDPDENTSRDDRVHP